MSYVVPSVLVYQQLATAGGVTNSTPDLEACIVGPAYNVLSYVANDSASQIETAATAAATATASITSGSTTLTFDVIPPFSVGDALLIAGASASKGTLAANVVSASGVVLTLDTAAGTTVTSAVVNKQGILTNPNISNTFNLPNQKAGQVIDASSISVYVNQAKIETLSTGFVGYAGNNALVYSAASGTVMGTAGSAVLTGVLGASKFVVGDTVTVTGAGAAGADLTTTIAIISGSTVTLNTPVLTSVSSAAMTKAAISNVSTTTSTLLVEAGDAVEIDYTNTSGASTKFNSSVLSVVSATGIITNITLADTLPTDVQVSTTSTAAIAAGAAGFTLTSSTGFSAGDVIVIKGAGANGADLETTIGSLTGSTVAGLNPVTITATTGPVVIQKRALITLKTRKLFNNQVVPATKPLSGGANYVTTNTAVDGTITINPGPEIIYGKLISGTVFIGYRALRTDLSGSIMTINDADDNLGQFGVISEQNPLALGCSIALANTTTRVRAIAIKSDDAQGYASALELAQAERVYALAPLTQELDILQEFALHAQQMSTAQEAMWRIAYVNSAIPTTVNVGQYTADIVNSNSGNNNISVVAGKYVLTSSNSTFVSDNVTPGDLVNITAGTGSPSPVGTMQVLQVISNQQIVVAAQGIASGVNFYISRALSKTQRAAAVAATSKTFGSNRVVHVQPDTVVVTISGRNVVLPGYYLCCALAGLTAGMPSQQGFTNMGIAGIADLSNSNFVFTRAQLGTMAEAGTLLFVQETAGGIPYVRHEITTDTSVYYYRELMAVKNWDFLSYFYLDKLAMFIGKWNITQDTMNTIRQTIDAASSLLKGQKQARIGAPLIDAKITSIAQDTNNVDNLNVNLSIKMPTTLNYLNLYLII